MEYMVRAMNILGNQFQNNSNKIKKIYVWTLLLKSNRMVEIAKRQDHLLIKILLENLWLKSIDSES